MLKRLGKLARRKSLLTSTELFKLSYVIQAEFGQQLTLQQPSLWNTTASSSEISNDKLLENEAAKLSLSVDDKTVRDNIVSLNVFKGPDAALIKFYNFALENAGYTSKEFEEEIRAETARNILSQSILSGNYQ